MKMKAVALGLLAWTLSGVSAAETIDVRIGHQSQVTNTVSGGIVLEKLGLLDKHLPREGKYAKVKYNIQFSDYDSGPPITNQMIAGRLEFGVMGDYPLIVNGARFQETGRMESRFIALTGYNLKGTGNGIVVPVNSPVQSLQDLAGKEISTPFGSAAWGMTLKALGDAGLSGKVNLRDQSPPVGVANIAAGRIDAHADFCPWSEVMEFRGTGRKILDGSEVGIPTFHGIVVREQFASRYPEVVQAVVDATLEAQRWIEEDPLRAAVKLSEWTGVEKEVLYLYFSQGGITTQDASIKPEWVEALKYDHALLQRERDVPPLAFERWIDDRYVKAGYAKLGVDYAARVKSLVSPAPNKPGLAPAEIWFAERGVVKYDSIAKMVAALHQAKGAKVYATYVYDASTGLKLFGKTAYLVKSGNGELVAFMKKADADAYIASKGGERITLAAL